jgi:orotidine-5'-phosphate decarboxylase
MEADERIILALDTADPEEALQTVHRFRDEVGIFKVGSELFTAAGPRIVKEINLMGRKVFLDLKFHDIPNTVMKSSLAVANLGVFMFNLHALGGMEMMKTAAGRLSEHCLKHNVQRPKIIAVTILTSIDQKTLRDELGIELRMNAMVKHLAAMARRAGLDGVVASARDAEMIRGRFGKDFLIVSPGIRPSWAAADDQKRTLTPKEAIRAGADYIVLGRAVLGQPDPERALMNIKEEIGRA